MTVKVSPALQQKAEEVARRKGLTLPDLYRQAVEEYCAREASVPSASRYDDVIGVMDAEPELSASVSHVFAQEAGSPRD